MVPLLLTEYSNTKPLHTISVILKHHHYFVMLHHLPVPNVLLYKQYTFQCGKCKLAIGT